MDMDMDMEALVQEISTGQCNRAKVKVKKVYLNEDPSKEETVPCPRCLRGNQQYMVRYMYISLNEAIYKCEAPNCMYPFRNFKFKNYDDHTVYQYEELPDQNHLDLDLLCSDFTPCSVSDSYGCGPEQSLDHFGPVDFNVDFPSTEPVDQHSFANASKSLPTEPRSQEVATTFDVGLIDDILQDLWPSKSTSTAPLSSTTVLMPNNVKNQQLSEEPKSTTKPNPPPSGRRLEKCLKAVQQTNKSLQDVTLKLPTETEESRKRAVHVVESITPTRLRIKKVSPRKRRKMNPPAKSNCPEKPYNPTMKTASDANTLVQTKAITPVEFVNQLNTLSRPPPSVCSDKAQRMLSFIQRSLRNRPRDDSVPPQSVAQARVVSNELQSICTPTVSDGTLQNQSFSHVVPCSSTAPSNDLAASGSVADAAPTLEKPVIEIKTCGSVTNGGMELLIRLLE